MTSYITPELYMPSGEKHSSKVVDVLSGVVNKIYSFTNKKGTKNLAPFKFIYIFLDIKIIP